jgi:hypothetical protein
MKIIWFDNDLPDGNQHRGDRAIVKTWVREHEEEVHDVSHLVGESEMEAVKIITGDQEVNSEGKVTLQTLELHFVKGLILIERVVEVQEPGSYTTKSASTQLGYLEAPHSGYGCRSPTPKKK